MTVKDAPCGHCGAPAGQDCEPPLRNATFTCTLCWRTSHNPNDARAGYCGRCHQYTPGVVCFDSTAAGSRRVEVFGKPYLGVVIGAHSRQFWLTALVGEDQVEHWGAILRVAHAELARMKERQS